MNPRRDIDGHWDGQQQFPSINAYGKVKVKEALKTMMGRNKG